MTVVLAIDQGTSGTKAVVVAPEGRILGVAEVAISPRYSAGGAVEQDPHELLDSVLESGRLALEQAGVSVDIVTLANQGESVLAWDPRTREPITPMIVWQDRRAEGICAELADRGDEIAERTGLVLDPYFSAPKQSWVRRELTREGVVTTSDSWLLAQLTGEFVTDVTTASRSLVVDLDTGRWDEGLLDVFGLADEPLPRIAMSDEIVGETHAFGVAVPVGGLVVDQQAALIAQSCLAPGEAKCTFGTGAFLLANSGGGAPRSSSGLSASVAWELGGERTYCFDGQVYTAASAVRWLRSLGFISEAADLDPIAEEDSDGVLSVPALAGLGAPWWKPDAKAIFAGMTLSTGPGHIVRAVLEGIAAEVAELGELAAADGGSPLTRLRVDGGLTWSRVLMQAVADLAQIEVDVYPSPHATPLGAAALARRAASPGLPLTEAVLPWSPTTVYTPRWTSARAEEFRVRWREVASRVG